MSGEPQGSEGYKIGNLRYELPTVPLAELDDTFAGEAGTQTVSVFITGLSAQVKLGVMVAYDNNGKNKIVAIPATGATMQITPFNKFGDCAKTYGRPVFQDPTSTTNSNDPQPQQVPFSWEGPFTMHNGAQVDVVFSNAAWNGAALLGRIVLQLVIEFNGHWWDVDAMKYVMAKVQVSDPPATLKIGTQ